jgi:hypothetical protein
MENSISDPDLSLIGTDDMLQEISKRHEQVVLVVSNQKTGGYRLLTKSCEDDVGGLSGNGIETLRILHEVMSSIWEDMDED